MSRDALQMAPCSARRHVGIPLCEKRTDDLHVRWGTAHKQNPGLEIPGLSLREDRQSAKVDGRALGKIDES